MLGSPACFAGIATYFVGVAIKDCYLHNFVVLGKKIAASHNEVVQAATLAIAKLLLLKGYRQRNSKKISPAQLQKPNATK